MKIKLILLFSLLFAITSNVLADSGQHTVCAIVGLNVSNIPTMYVNDGSGNSIRVLGPQPGTWRCFTRQSGTISIMFGDSRTCYLCSAAYDPSQTLGGSRHPYLQIIKYDTSCNGGNCCKYFYYDASDPSKPIQSQLIPSVATTCFTGS